jgi:hypothetical protein
MTPQTAVAMVVLSCIFGLFFGICTGCIVRQWVHKRCGGEVYPAPVAPVSEGDLLRAAEIARSEVARRASVKAAAQEMPHCIVVQPGLCEGDGGAVALALAIPDNICAYGNGSGAKLGR